MISPNWLALDKVEGELNEYARRVDILLATFRTVILALLISISFMLGITLAQKEVLISLGGLMASAAISFYCSIAGHRHWSLTWGLATADAGFLLSYLVTSSLFLQLPLNIALSSPGAWLVFVYLIMGVLRLHPPLVIYSGLLFVGGWYLIVAALPSGHQPVDIAHAAGHFAQAGRATDAIRLFIIFVSTISLAFAAWHSRRSLLKAIQETSARENLSTHFPKEVLGRLLKDRALRPSLRKTEAAIIFVDVCGFTALSEETDCEVVAQYLVHFRSRIHGVVTDYGGVVDKFIGDGVLIVFGLPYSRPDDAARALGCVMELRSSLAEWIPEQIVTGRAQPKYGVGAHYGEVLAGLIGDDERVEFTVLGDTVNVAARLQKLANANDGDTLISEDLIMAAGLKPDDYGHRIVTVPVRGRRGSVNVVGLNSFWNHPVAQGSAA